MSDASAKDSLRDYAAFLESCLRDRLNIEVPANFVAIFVNHARRLAPDDYEELGSYLLLECQERRASGEPLDGKELTRIVDRLQHRIARLSRRELPLDVARFLPTGSSLSPEQAEKVVKAFLTKLSPTEAVVFELRCLQAQSVADISQETGLSQATVYRLLGSLRNKFEKFLGRC